MTDKSKQIVSDYTETEKEIFKMFLFEYIFKENEIHFILKRVH